MRLLLLVLFMVGELKAQYLPFPGPVMPSVSGGIALVSVTPAIGGVNGGSTAASDTRGANFIIVGIVTYNISGIPTLTDSITGTTTCASPCNTWTPLTLFGGGSSLAGVQLYKAFNPIVGSQHVFTITGSSTFSVISYIAFSGVPTGAIVTSSNVGNDSLSGSPVSGGTTTPDAANELVISLFGGHPATATISVASPLTATTVLNGANGIHWAYGLAYEIQTASTARNPSWTLGTVGGDSGVTNVVIK